MFEPGEPGRGLHLADQGDHLLLNTVAGQLSLFPHADAVGGHGRRRGPTLDAWCREKGIRIDERSRVVTGDGGREVRPGDFLPRRLLGDYLADCAANLLQSGSSRVRVTLVPEAVVAMNAVTGERRHELVTASGVRHSAHAVFLALGHTSGPGFDQAEVDAISAGEEVAIAGLGLTAMDLVAALTQGRGGHFTFEGGRQVYVPSGREPRLHLYSRKGLPYRARPVWSAEDAEVRHRAIVFTPAAIDAKRRAKPEGGLDFRKDVLPLIQLEMRAAFHLTKTRLRDGRVAWLALWDELAAAATRPRGIEEALGVLDRSQGPFLPEIHTRIDTWSGDPRRHAEWFRQMIADDLAEARRGVAGSPIKAALEVWRNERDTIRHAVNWEALDPWSRVEFYRDFAGVSNRLVGGPQKERHEDLLALMDAGIVSILPPMISIRTAEGVVTVETLGGGSVRVARHIEAFVPGAGLGQTANPLLRSLAAAGRLVPVSVGLDGVRVDRSAHPVARDGSVDPTVWVVGPNVEGSTYYNHYVATPAPDCRLVVDAQANVAACLAQLEATFAPVAEAAL